MIGIPKKTNIKSIFSNCLFEVKKTNLSYYKNIVKIIWFYVYYPYNFDNYKSEFKSYLLLSS